MNLFGGATSLERSQVDTFEISGLGKTIHMKELDSRFYHLCGLPANQYDDATPLIQIGLEHAAVFITMNSYIINNAVRSGNLL